MKTYTHEQIKQLNKLSYDLSTMRVGSKKWNATNTELRALQVALILANEQ